MTVRGVRGAGVALAAIGIVGALLDCTRQRAGAPMSAGTATTKTASEPARGWTIGGGSPEHMRAVATGLEHANDQVEKGNATHQWETKGSRCDPRDLARPNAGKDLREPPGIGGCPPGMAPVFSKRGVCIDRWEAHLVAPLDDGTEQTWSPYSNPGSVLVRAKSAPLAVPQGYISQVQAASACAAVNKSLCTDAEWIAACRGSSRTSFPYGNTELLGTCNDHRDRHPAAEYLESRSTSVFGKLEHPCINQVPDSLLPTGTKKDCVTPEGVYDMVGNLHEWTASTRATFRGGYYVDTQLNGHGCDYVTNAHERTYWDYSTGFRCCAVDH
jgi:sulfatase modifying factor 1